MNYFLAGGTLSITFIPLFSSYIADEDEEGGWRLFSNIATTMGGVLFVFVILLELLAPYAVPALNPGFDDPRQVELAIWMTRIVIPAQLAFYLGGLLQATLYVREIFWPSAVAPLVYNLCIILGGVLLDPWLGIGGFSVGVIVGAFLGPLGLPLWAARRNVEYSPVVEPTDEDFKTFVKLTLPLMVGVSLLTVDEWLLRYFGSNIEGAITWLNDARKLMLVIFAIIGQAAGQAALPYLSRLYSENKPEEMGEMLANSLQRVAFLATIGAAGLIVAAEPIVFLVFQRGAFTPADAHQTADLLMIFALGLVSWSVQSLAARGFYARKNTLTPMLIGTGVVAVALPLYFQLFDAYGVTGLAFGTTIGITLNASATVIVYRLQTGQLPAARILAGLARGLLFGSVCAAAAWGVERAALHYTSVNLNYTLDALGLGLAMGLGFFAAGGLLALIYRPPELRRVLDRVSDKLPG